MDSSEAGETKVITGSQPLARSQGPKKVTFGTIPVADFQVDGKSTTEEEERGQGRWHTLSWGPVNREAGRDAGFTGCSNHQGTGEAAVRPGRIAAAPRAVRRRERSTSEVGRSRTCRFEGGQRDDCRKCPRCKDMPRYYKKNRIEKQCVKMACLGHQSTGEPVSQPGQSAASLRTLRGREE